MSDVVIKVENISKQYRLGQVSTGTISHDLNRWWYTVRGKEDPYLGISEENPHLAVTHKKDIQKSVPQTDLILVLLRQKHEITSWLIVTKFASSGLRNYFFDIRDYFAHCQNSIFSAITS